MKRFKKRYQTWVGGLIGLYFFLPFSCRLQVVECDWKSWLVNLGVFFSEPTSYGNLIRTLKVEKRWGI